MGIRFFAVLALIATAPLLARGADLGTALEVFSRPEVKAHAHFKNILGDNPYVFETASRIVQFSNPLFLETSGISCWELLRNPKTDFAEMIRRLKEPEVQELALEWTSRISAYLADPKATGIMRLAIDITLPSNQIKFLDSEKIYVIPASLVNTQAALWTGFGLPQEHASAVETPPTMWADFKRPVQLTPLLGRANSVRTPLLPKQRIPVAWREGDGDVDSLAEMNNSEPRVYRSATQYAALIVIAARKYSEFMQLGQAAPIWEENDFYKFFHAAQEYHDAILELYAVSIASPPVTGENHFLRLARNLAIEALQRLPGSPPGTSSLYHRTQKMEYWVQGGLFYEAFGAYEKRLAELARVAASSDPSNLN